MTRATKKNVTLRRFFSTSPLIAEMPPLLQLQEKSYEQFLQIDTPPDARKKEGLEGAFHSIFPIVSSSGLVSLEFKGYKLHPPTYDIDECKERGLSYQSSLYAEIYMIIREKKDGDIKSVKSEDVYMGDIPRMTSVGSFVVNGTERVVVSQLHRSPGVIFEHDFGRTDTVTGKYIYSARVIPYNGRWLDFEFDKRDSLYFRIDRRRKMPASVLLKALGYSEEKILEEFYKFENFSIGKKNGQVKYLLNKDFIKNNSFQFDIKSASGAIIVPKGQRVKIIDLAKIGTDAIKEHPVPDDFLIGRRLAKAIVDSDGEVLARANAEITETLLEELRAAKVDELQTIYTNELDCGNYISQTMLLDEKLDEEASRSAIYRMLRPGEPPNRDLVNQLLDGIFTSSISYSLSHVGRMKFNRRIDSTRPAMEYRIVIKSLSRGNKSQQQIAAQALIEIGAYADEEAALAFLKYVNLYGDRACLENISRESADKITALIKGRLVFEVLEQTTLSRNDILLVVKKLVSIRNGLDNVDDIDTLSNRRIRSVGEFVGNYFRQGLMRVERAIRDRLSRAEIEGLMPHDLISAKAISGSIVEFFNGNQLSQFMDQTNPLSEVTHKRRVSALGIGGLSRDRVGFEVRDVHPTHYGRLCPIETPEGQNIGLINSLANYAEVNEYGFLQTPYQPVKDGKVGKDIVSVSAIDEEGCIIAQAVSRRDSKGKLTDDIISARKDGEFISVDAKDVDYVDVAPAQVASVASSLIPFLEHDDANRALMGSNMQRQAVPCLTSERPFVGTGMERKVAVDSGGAIIARNSGVVCYVDASRVVIRIDEDDGDESSVDIYDFVRHTRSNQNTNVNYRPIVMVGEKIDKGAIIADGACSDFGDLALGQNLLVAFMPWNGYNFEDSILISERVVSEQRFSSIHIIEEIAHARVTQLGSEEITRDIPHQSDNALRNLDDEGIIHVGKEVNPGDILVGKVTPKSEKQLSPEEKLLRAVFGDKAADVKDTSLKMSQGSSGVVIDVKVFTSEDSQNDKKNGDGDDRAAGILAVNIQAFKKKQRHTLKILETGACDRIRQLLRGKKASVGSGAVKRGSVISITNLKDLTKEQLFKIRISDEKVNERIVLLEKKLASVRSKQVKEFAQYKKKLVHAPDLSQGILKTVKVYVAIKRNLQVGDKMAGRHGNKGVVSKIVPVESMPYMADGTPADVVLNPLGVPSRMNIGQILETHLGLAAKGLGIKISKILEDETKKSLQSLRTFLGKIYAGSTPNDIPNMSDEELLETAKALSSGVPFASPIFDGASEENISRMLDLADLPRSGQMTMYDGQSGEPFMRPVTLGYAYIMKLHHLVDEKMHARATGPYSLVTQQPLGGKAQRGGQRLGEMEVWALEAYGAAYTLCEMLTVKSDDIFWRTKMFEDITEGDFQLKSGIPESFNVLMQEIKAMGIDMELK